MSENNSDLKTGEYVFYKSDVWVVSNVYVNNQIEKFDAVYELKKEVDSVGLEEAFGEKEPDTEIRTRLVDESVVNNENDDGFIRGLVCPSCMHPCVRKENSVEPKPHNDTFWCEENDCRVEKVARPNYEFNEVDSNEDSEEETEDDNEYEEGDIL